MRSIVLAAGRGVRMLPLTENVPKVLVPVSGKPFLWYVLKNMKSAGLLDVCLIVGYKKEKIFEFTREFQKENSEMRFSFIEQDEQLGTAHATSLAREFCGSEDFISINGDNLYSPGDLEALKNFGGICIGGIEVADPRRYGVLDVQNGKLKKIIEKPQSPPSNLINTALYRFTPKIFSAIEKIGKSPAGEFYITDAISLLAAGGKVFVLKLKDYWLDLGKPDDIKIIEEFLKKNPIE